MNTTPQRKAGNSGLAHILNSSGVCRFRINGTLIPLNRGHPFR